MRGQSPASTLLAYPFRPFFLLGACYAALSMALWSGLWIRGWSLPLALPPVSWHAHEMLFGFVPAIIAGFLLTAMTNWTGAQPLQGKALLALVLLWIAGRIAMVLGRWLPQPLVAAVDLAFLPVVAVYAGRVLQRHGNRRNYPLVGVLGLLAVANLLMHLEPLSFAGTGRHGVLLGTNLLTLLMIVIAGRITPAFTANWLRLRGSDPDAVRRPPSVDRVAVGTIVLMIVADHLGTAPWLGAVLAMLAAVANGVRLAGWSGWSTRTEPLLWILHVGYGWIVLALALKGMTYWWGWPPAVWLHAMGAGAMGTLILGVMTRVALGHTGRPLRLPRFALGIYLLVLAAGALRVLMAMGHLDPRSALMLSASAWIAAFVLFVVLYGPMLSQPRPDRRPG